jgi:hypothetical protein
LKVGNRTIFLTAILLITILIVDTALERISDLLGTQSSDYTSRVVLFIAITLIIYVVGEYLILSFIKRRNNEIIQTITSITREERTTTPTKTVITNKNKFLARITLLYKTILTVQVILTVIIVSIILSMIFASHYYTSLLITSTVISYGFAIVLLVLLTQRLISWFKRTKKMQYFFRMD